MPSIRFTRGAAKEEGKLRVDFSTPAGTSHCKMADPIRWAHTQSAPRYWRHLPFQFSAAKREFHFFFYFMFTVKSLIGYNASFCLELSNEKFIFCMVAVHCFIFVPTNIEH